MELTKPFNGTAVKRKPVDLFNLIIAYEQGELEEEDIILLFQALVDTGMAWQLQGNYNRTAKALIDKGIIHAK